ncbi:MAG: RsmD family RNA methyltransferase, partial [Stellaceae bacterium]
CRIFPGDATRPPRGDRSCALAFLDPPYASELAAPALSALAAVGWIASGALAIVEIGAREELVAPAGFTLIDERVYGAACLVFLRSDGAGGDTT